MADCRARAMECLGNPYLIIRTLFTGQVSRSITILAANNEFFYTSFRNRSYIIERNVGNNLKIIKKREEKSRLFNPFATREKTVASQFLFVEKKKKRRKICQRKILGSSVISRALHLMQSNDSNESGLKSLHLQRDDRLC